MLAALGLSAETADAQVIHVNAAVVGGNGSGDSWPNAKPDLNDALSDADGAPYLLSTGENTAIIWVAAGDYNPGYQQLQHQVPPATDPQGLTFRIPHGVEVIGAFPNTGSPGAPDLSLVSQTVLHGDWLSGSQTIRANNVVICDPGSSGSALALADQTKIHNFTIQNGRAAGLPSTEGGGIFSFSEPGDPAIGLDVRDCIFVGNSALTVGGAIYFDGAETLVWLGIFRSKFVNNLAVNRGGAVYMNNIGAASSIEFSQPSFIYNCLFRGNMAGVSTDPLLTSENGGGAIYVQNYDNFPSFVNNLIHGNFVRGWGSAIAIRPNQAAGHVVISNNTITQNVGIVGPEGIPIGSTTPGTAPGGALALNDPSALLSVIPYDLDNNIIWKNENVGVGTEIVGDAMDVNVAHSDVYMSLQGQVWPGPGNINTLPNFTSAIAGDFHITNGPCIDTGNDAFLPLDYPFFGSLPQGSIPVINYDYVGDPILWPRSYDDVYTPNAPGLTDMGCYEFQKK